MKAKRLQYLYIELDNKSRSDKFVDCAGEGKKCLICSRVILWMGKNWAFNLLKEIIFYSSQLHVHVLFKFMTLDFLSKLVSQLSFKFPFFFFLLKLDFRSNLVSPFLSKKHNFRFLIQNIVFFILLLKICVLFFLQNSNFDFHSKFGFWVTLSKPSFQFTF